MITQNLTYKEIKKYKNLLPVIPVGSFEQHGPYLPLGTDAIIAESLALYIEKVIPGKVIVYPTLWYGCSKEHKDFSGTATLEFSTFMKMANEILESIFNSGFKKAIFLNGHGGNHLILQIICQSWNYEHEQKAYYLFAFEKKVDEFAEKLFGESEPHAGSVETSLVYGIDKKFIKTSEKTFLVKSNKERIKRNYDLYKTWEMSKSGIVARNNRINIDVKKGKQLYQMMVKYLTKQIREILAEK